MSTFSSANIMDGNLVLKERTHKIKIKYSMHQYSIHLHNLGNWLICTVNEFSVFRTDCYCFVTTTMVNKDNVK